MGKIANFFGKLNPIYIWDSYQLKKRYKTLALSKPNSTSEAMIETLEKFKSRPFDTGLPTNPKTEKIEIDLNEYNLSALSEETKALIVEFIRKDTEIRTDRNVNNIQSHNTAWAKGGLNNSEINTDDIEIEDNIIVKKPTAKKKSTKKIVKKNEKI
jgi:hypothetical protein